MNALIDVVPATSLDQVVRLTASALFSKEILTNIDLSGRRDTVTRHDLVDLLIQTPGRVRYRIWTENHPVATIVA